MDDTHTLLRDFVEQLTNHSPHLANTLTVADFVRFASLGGEVQHRAGDSLRLSPSRMPLLDFLASALSPQYPSNLMGDLWLHTFPVLPACRIDVSATIREFGLQPDLKITSKMPEKFLRVPVSHCFLCSSTDKSYALHVHSRTNGYLYDFDGPHAIQTVVLNCSNTKCGTTYRPSYYTQGTLRYYYTPEMGRNPEFLHVHCHFYITRRLADMFRVIQMLAHVSHFNLVNWFNTMFVDNSPVPMFTTPQGFSPSMSEETCRDGLILHSLIKHADRRGTQVVVSSSGTDVIRFDYAIENHLNQLLLEGTRYRNHYCSTCVKLKSRIDPVTGEHTYQTIRAVVTDGLTIGHWRCSASTQQLEELAASRGLPPPEGPCTKRLVNINDRFCADHFRSLGRRCRAQPCCEESLPNSHTCANPDHIKAWDAFSNRTKGNFSLTAILNRPGSNLPSDPTVHLDSNTAQFNDLESVQQSDESNRAHESARDGGESQACGKYVLTRSRTHNDQLIVTCCGIILARKTFYNAESVSAVKDFLEETFPQAMPEVVFYDNACRLTEHVYTGQSDSSKFMGTVIPVDPFHHRSHAESDEFCKLFTDPKLFPDIQENGRWIFNASAAELTNIWYGGFASMCRNMHSLVYNLFLEEMVYLRNAWLTKRLDKRPGMEYLGEGII
ncbi:hypothetical protein DFH28DRAFT_1161758 [Melampsora americana]|nr:hypothetical protein DFH28DRAFT_1161758 [Melampsora americana]